MNILKNITLGRYIGTDSAIHRLDPRTKLITLVTLSLVIFYAVTPGWAGIITLGAIFLVSLFTVTLANIKVAYVVKCILKFFWFFLFIIIFHAFFTPGRVIPLLERSGIVMTYEGVESAALMACQLFVVIQCTYIFILTTSPLEITNGVKKLLSFLKVFKVQVDDIAIMVTLAIRFIPTLFKEIQKISDAQKARGVVFSEGSIKQRIKALSLIVTPIFYNTFKRAEELNTAMICRGYRAGALRSSYKSISFRPVDYAVLTLVLTFFVFSMIRGVM